MVGEVESPRVQSILFGLYGMVENEGTCQQLMVRDLIAFYGVPGLADVEHQAP